MPLLDLANEVLLFVVQGLESVRDINAFSQSNRRLHVLLNRYLYRFDIEQFSAEGLLWAITRGNDKTPGVHEAIVALLLEKGADPNGWNGQSRSALNTAAYHGNVAMATLLLDHGADINALGSRYDSSCAIHVACNVWSTPMVELLLETGADVHAVAATQNTVIQEALSSEFVAIIPLLLEKGADVNANGRPYFGGSLHQAASMGNGYEAVVSMLLEKGADVNARGGVFANALQAVVARGCTTIVELLLERGADVNARGGRSYDALQAALDQGNEAIAALLLRNGARQNLKDSASERNSK